MATRSKSANELAASPAMSRTNAVATLAVAPTCQAAAVVQTYSIHGELDFDAVHDALLEHCGAIHRGDLRRVECMLAAQASSLDAIFAKLARRAEANMAEHFDAAEALLKLALKAQGQCRATLETLATIKAPPVVIARQANIAQGHQQVNNGTAAPATRAEAIEIQPNELMGGNHGERERERERLDARAPAAASAGDPTMATVATLHRAPHGRRQGRRQPECLEGR